MLELGLTLIKARVTSGAYFDELRRVDRTVSDKRFNPIFKMRQANRPDRRIPSMSLATTRSPRVLMKNTSGENERGLRPVDYFDEMGGADRTTCLALTLTSFPPIPDSSLSPSCKGGHLKTTIHGHLLYYIEQAMRQIH